VENCFLAINIYLKLNVPQVSLTSLLLAPLALLKTFKDFVGSEDDIKRQIK
jgi:hypothetical protein